MTIKNLIFIGVIIFLGTLYLSQKREASVYRGALINYQDSVRLVIDSQGKKIFTQNQTIVTDKRTIAELTEKNELLSNVTGQIKWRERVVYSRDTIVTDSLVYDDDCIKIPFSFQVNNQWYGYKFTIDKGVIFQDSLYFISHPTISIGYSKNKWYELFKNNNPIVTYTNENPFVDVQDMSNIFLEKPKKAVTLGIQVGYYMTPKGFQPGVGLGLNFKPW